MTEPEALDWLATLFNQPAGSLQPDTPRDTIPEWDSLGVLNLMAGLDEKFGILLADDALKAMTRPADVLEVLRSNGKLS